MSAMHTQLVVLDRTLFRGRSMFRTASLIADHSLHFASLEGRGEGIFTLSHTSRLKPFLLAGHFLGIILVILLQLGLSCSLALTLQYLLA